MENTEDFAQEVDRFLMAIVRGPKKVRELAIGRGAYPSDYPFPMTDSEEAWRCCRYLAARLIDISVKDSE